MSKTGSWVLGMQEDAAVMNREEFVKRYGSAQVDIWDRVNADEYDHEPDPEEFECYGA